MILQKPVYFDGKQVRTVRLDENTVWFSVVDVCDALHVELGEALAHVRSEGYRQIPMTSPTQGSQMLDVIPTVGVLRVMALADHDLAHLFLSWLYYDVFEKVYIHK